MQGKTHISYENNKQPRHDIILGLGTGMSTDDHGRPTPVTIKFLRIANIIILTVICSLNEQKSHLRGERDVCPHTVPGRVRGRWRRGSLCIGQVLRRFK